MVFAIAPRILDDTGFTIAGAAMLKGCLSRHGYTSKILDLNNNLEEMYKDDPNTLTALGNFFMSYEAFNSSVFAEAEKCIDKWAREIVDLKPKWLGISVFTYNSTKATRLLALYVKKLDSSIKIVIGGAGITNDYAFTDFLYNAKIIDAYVRGEGEIALIELMKGNYNYPGINNIPVKQIDDLASIPFPDYSDYEIMSYTNSKGLVGLPITGSRGCVRKCTFCDINVHWPKYRYRPGKNIADEFKYQIEKHGVNFFKFTDSLVNGSLKAFKEMVYELAEYRKSLPDDKKFYWRGHFIIRGKAQMPPQLFDKMKESGAELFYIGVESGSPRVRDHMKKGFTEDELDYCMEQVNRVGIKVRVLVIVGYPTETLEDFEMTVKMFDRYKPYLDNGTIDQVNLGETLLVLPGTPLDLRKKELGIIKANNHISDWICRTNPSLDYKERLRRRIWIQEHIEKLGYSVWDSDNYAQALYVAWNQISKFPNTAKKILEEEEFHYDRELGGIVLQEKNKKIKSLTIKKYENSNYI